LAAPEDDELLLVVDLGGEDFVDAIVATFMAGPGAAAGLPAADSGAPIIGALRRQAEMAKRQLSSQDAATIALVHDGKPIEWMLGREQFELMSEPLLARLRAPVERALRDARVDPDALSRIILAGGASQMPMFRRLIARLFRRLPVYQVNPEEVVGRGAAVRAGMLARGAGLEEMVMTDVAPFTLGVEISEQHGEDTSQRIHGRFMPIIERNTIIPASRSKLVHPIDDKQRNLVLRAFQGEAPLVKDNVLLGELTIKLPPGPATKQNIDVRFTYDTSGLLEVQATILSSGRIEKLVIEGNPGVMQPDEIAKRLAALAKLKIHPRDDMKMRALMARAARLYEERLGEIRAMIGRAIGGLTAALDRQEPEEIEAASDALSALLDEFDQDFLI
jgi:molecular chaperone HscC